MPKLNYMCKIIRVSYNLNYKCKHTNFTYVQFIPCQFYLNKALLTFFKNVKLFILSPMKEFRNFNMLLMSFPWLSSTDIFIELRTPKATENNKLFFPLVSPYY